MASEVKTCPCCGHPIAGEIALSLPGKQRRLFELVERAGVAGVSSVRIMDALYGDDPTGGPESPNIIPAMIWNINRHIAQHGLVIRGNGRGRPRGFFRLMHNGIETNKSDPSS